MNKISKLKFNIFYDGVNIKNYINDVDGVTTNTSFIAAAKITNYNKFIEESLKEVKGKPISFQVIGRTFSEIENQARFICGLGENVYVKIPVILPDASSTIPLIKDLSDDGLKINATCIHTLAQIDETIGCLNEKADSIISVFAGGISDSGNDPSSLIRHATQQVQEFNGLRILWAGCQNVLHVFQAAQLGCHIVTVPDAIMNKLCRTQYSIHETSVRKSNTFFNDGDLLELVLENT